MILVDTDVLIDVALERQPFVDSAFRLMREIEQGAERACVSWHTVANFYYVVAPRMGSATTRESIVELVRVVGVAAATAAGVRYAAGLPMADFEDAMQVAAAHACGARCIVTRNIRDYRNSPIAAITPQQALAEFA